MGKRRDPIPAPPELKGTAWFIFLLDIKDSTWAVGILKKQAETPPIHLFAICSLIEGLVCARYEFFLFVLLLLLLFLPVPGPPFPGNTSPSFVMTTKACFNWHLKYSLNYCGWFQYFSHWYHIEFGFCTRTPTISLTRNESKDSAWHSRSPQIFCGDKRHHPAFAL